MDRMALPGTRTGSVQIPSSKSQLHRLLLCAAVGEGEVALRCSGISKDIAATIECLRALGASIEKTKDNGLLIHPIPTAPTGLRTLPCGESGSTLRFLLPLAGALGVSAVFSTEGRLPERPMEPLVRELRRNGMTIRQEGALLYSGGKLCTGNYRLPGNVSSQYISGLLMALPRLSGESTLHIDGETESAAYVAVTEQVLRLGGVQVEKINADYRISGAQRCRFPREVSAEGDYSNAAFFLCAGALSKNGICVNGLPPQSAQGDRAVLSLLSRMGAHVSVNGESVMVRRGELRGITIDSAQIPDLVPALSVIAAGAEGETRVMNAARLRLKESDRLHSTAQLLCALGGEVEELPDGLVIRGKKELSGGAADACGDHRIAMSAAVAASLCRNAVTIRGSECVEKSYPDFWRDFENLEREGV